MSQRTQRFLMVIAQYAAAAWFFGLRGRVGQFFGALQSTYRGPVDELDRLEQVPALSYVARRN